MQLFRARGRRAALMVLAASMAVVVAACGSSSHASSTSGSAPATKSDGSSSSGGSSSTAFAKAAVTKYTPMITNVTAPGPALSGLKGKLSGKTIWYVPTFLQAPIFTADATDLTQPFGLVGATVHVCNADSNPSTAASCINEAVKAHAAGIITDAMDDSFASSAYAAAFSAKIPVVATDNDDPQGFPKTSDVVTVDTGIKADAALAADYIIANSNGAANILYAADNSNDGVVEATATAQEFAKCSSCKVTNVAFGDETVQNLSTAVPSALVKDPSINFIDGGYDAPSGIYALQGAKTVTGRHFLYITSTGQPPGLERVAQGTQAADPGQDPDLSMWNTADAMFRIILGKSPASAYNPGLRIFTHANVPSDVSSPSAYASGDWYSNGAFKAMYSKLWGL